MKLTILEEKQHIFSRNCFPRTTYSTNNAWLRVPLYGNIFLDRGPTELSPDSWKSSPFQPVQSRVVDRRRFDQLLTPSINEGALRNEAEADPYARYQPGPHKRLPKLPIYPSPRPHDQVRLESQYFRFHVDEKGLVRILGKSSRFEPKGTLISSEQSKNYFENHECWRITWNRFPYHPLFHISSRFWWFLISWGKPSDNFLDCVSFEEEKIRSYFAYRTQLFLSFLLCVVTFPQLCYRLRLLMNVAPSLRGLDKHNITFLCIA